MKKVLILLLFFSCLNVNSKTIITPYLKVREVSSNYKVNSLEKVDVVTFYKQEKINRDYKYLEKANDIYTIKTNEVKYGEYSDYQEKRIKDDSLDEERSVIYYYQELKKIDSLKIEKVNNLLITKIILKYKDNIIYKGNDLDIKLSKKYSPEDLELYVTCFLNQGDIEGEFTVSSDDYINSKFVIKDKGYSEVDIKIINHLCKTMYEDKILKTSNLDNKFYINIVDKKVFYRYRDKYYKYYRDDIILDTNINPLYKIVGVTNKYYLYRKEIIEVFDDIKLSNYLDISKVIKSSTIPLGELEFIYDNETCGESVLTLKYKDFKVNLDVNFECVNYPKSKIHKGVTKSFKREVFGILFKTLFLRNL